MGDRALERHRLQREFDSFLGLLEEEPSIDGGRGAGSWHTRLMKETVDDIDDIDDVWRLSRPFDDV